AAEPVGLEQVDDLEASLEHAGLGVELVEGRRWTVDLPLVDDALGERLALGVEGLADDVEDVAEGARAHRHLDAVTEILYRRPSLEAVGGLHGNGPHPALTDVLRHLGHDFDALALDLDLE